MSEHTAQELDAAREAAQKAVDTATSWDYSASDAKIADKLQEGLDAAGVTVDTPEFERLVRGAVAGDVAHARGEPAVGERHARRGRRPLRRGDPRHIGIGHARGGQLLGRLGPVVGAEGGCGEPGVEHRPVVGDGGQSVRLRSTIRHPIRVPARPWWARPQARRPRPLTRWSVPDALALRSRWIRIPCSE